MQPTIAEIPATSRAETTAGALEKRVIEGLNYSDRFGEEATISFVGVWIA